MAAVQRPSQIVHDAGQRLRAIRLHLDLSQTEFGRAIGVGPSRLSQWETGKFLVDVVAAIKIRTVYGVPLDFLYAGDPARLPYELASALREEPAPHYVESLGVPPHQRSRAYRRRVS